MAPTTNVDPNIIFNKIKNQFLAAITGVIVLVISAITLIISTTKKLEIFHIFGVSALIFVTLISCFIVIKLNNTLAESKKINDSRNKNVAEASHNLWRLIIGLGEACLESEITVKKRIFVSDALSQVIENELELLKESNSELKEILEGIKRASDSEISQGKIFTTALGQQKVI